ncbi:hypothetical protein NX801_18600 [Streptomyces sp. LP05-1]|uniref:Secreted protein n=1 Tax=Streptomyces pyxinae TaxID=2970734 RepID=A0ABT2CKN4_9ACTN|nr:hypothetical protein [Streptomyces sp. LP05-1]MCS0637637.1 hypothetical protein [Streptomyces sp. LP05-1]
MRPIRPLLAASVTALLVLAATGCGPSEDNAGGDPAASASPTASGRGGKIHIPDRLRDRLKEHGIDVDKWQDGAWKNWDKDAWLREARDFVNPVIEDLWDARRMREAREADTPVPEADVPDGNDAGVTDPAPEPVTARQVPAPYHRGAPEAGKILFDGPEGSMVCSGTVVRDPAHPGKSNLVWTAGHCVHAGKKGGWYRNIAFVPSYNDRALPSDRLNQVGRQEIAPYGVWWGDWAATSDEWIAQGASTGGQGAPYDYAVVHVTPEEGGGTSLEETVGSALPVDFAAPAAPEVASIEATGYPAAAPYDGQRLHQCADKPGRLSLAADQPTMYRIGCTMTGGASGGGWVAPGRDGKPALVSNTSIGPVPAGWLAGPRLGDGAKRVYEEVSRKFAGQ